VDVSRGAPTNRAFEDPDLMPQSQDLELEVKARTKDRTQSDEKCEQGSGHRRREFGQQYNSFPLRSFRISGRHSMPRATVSVFSAPFSAARHNLSPAQTLAR
jgi:hypothetical protein